MGEERWKLSVINSGSVQREGGKKQKTEVRSESTSGLFWGLGPYIRLATAKPALSTSGNLYINPPPNGN